ncbi:alanine/glycine:cation symporter family protein [Nocardia goodfellowii]|uniref:AGCS family alanine or glycine:cation symporter n=1 Tax=Nocardia goodfellowii TaxID=882446 RepID=A0ABS4QIE8_9NOCA|nr:alanine/glycine:cation symporter family protein [Nocardia goodfellowii]MBP2191476.1 AGCS family alanine or glycine:cation symporter [Nocardia goodfellowii]
MTSGSPIPAAVNPLLAADFEWFRHDWLTGWSDIVYLWIVAPLLIAAGAYFTVRTRGVQFRRFASAARLSMRTGLFAEDHDSARPDAQTISGFAAFCVGLAARTGTGNIAGMAVALVVGGPGAILWMWVVAALSMACSVVENTLAQIYKEPLADGSFRGGPAFYLEKGLGAERAARVFAVLFLLAVGFAFVMVQANTITDAIRGATQVDARTIAVPMAAGTAWIIFRGASHASRFLSTVTPWIAGAYIVFGLTVLFLNIGRLPEVLRLIVQSAFGVGPMAAGLAGGMMIAVTTGARRGLFSNEAGMGMSPNAAGSATGPHPADQGFVQAFGVFISTYVICTLSALVILLAAGGAYQPGQETGLNGAQLVGVAAGNQFGAAGEVFIVLALFLFGYQSIIANYTMCEGNITNIFGWGARRLFAFRGLLIAAILAGSVLALETVWAIGDIFVATMAVINLTAIVLLFGQARAAILDWDAQCRARHRPRFVESTLPRPVPGAVWSEKD